MKHAITKVYEERNAAAERRKAAERVFSQENDRRRRAKHVAEMRAKRNNSITPPPTAIPELPGDSPTSYSPVAFSATTSFSPVSPSNAPLASAPLRASNPSPPPPPPPPQYFTAATLTSPKQAKYPLEKAVFQIVGMGFTAAEAKRALAETDTHDRLDVHAAVEVLLKRRKATNAGMGRVPGRVELVWSVWKVVILFFPVFLRRWQMLLRFFGKQLSRSSPPLFFFF
jgi:hypothetical protein